LKPPCRNRSTSRP